MKYRSEIDGLRAIAVVPVVLFHAKVTGFSGGFVGVDIFFVISGYLITEIILKDLKEDKFTFSRFYERRARRILPALSFVMFCCLPLAWAWMLPQDLIEFGKSLVATSVFGSNILFWRESGYFAAAAEFKPLLHTWSLAVEEQYYLFYPIMIAVIWRRKREAVLPAVLVLIVLSLALSEWGWRNKPSANFYLLPPRGWELLIGAVIAIGFSKKIIKSDALSLIGLGMILGSVFFFDSNTPTPSIWLIFPVFGTALILTFSHQGTFSARLLSLKPLVATGLISYSLYLWYQPILAFVRIRVTSRPDGLLLFAVLAVTIILAWVTWRLIERPFRGSSPIFSKRLSVGVASMASIGLMSALGTTFVLGGGFNDRLSPSGKTFSSVGDFEKILAPNFGLHSDCDVGKFTLSSNCRTSNTPTIALWGDSFAMHLAPALTSSFSSKPFVQLSLSQCGPIPGMAINGSMTSWEDCLSFNDNVVDWILKTDAIDLVIVSSPFDQIKADIFTRTGKILTDRASKQAAIYIRMQALSESLTAAGKKLVIVSPPPRNGVDLGRCYVRNLMMANSVDECDIDERRFHAYSADSIALLHGLETIFPVIWLDRFLCRNARCDATIDGTSLYRDSGHLSVLGSEKLGERIDLMGIIRSWSQVTEGSVSALQGIDNKPIQPHSFVER